MDDFWDMPKSIGGIGGAMIASRANWPRKLADVYPTPPDAVYSVIPYIEDILPIGSRILEPACGDGSMSRALEEFGYIVDSYDIRTDSGYGYGGIDFLTHDHDKYDAVITNPPFSLAEEFIVRALEIAPVVVFFLKATYWNVASRKKLFRQSPFMRQLNLTWRPAFLEAERGRSPLMDCIWCVWHRGYKGLPTVDVIDRVKECPRPEAWYGGL